MLNQEISRSRTFQDYGINVPDGASGEVRETCPECSADRRKPSDQCLAVNADDGCWYCHHCGWSGGLGKSPTYRKVFKATKPKLTPDKSARIQSIWSNGIPLQDSGARPAQTYYRVVCVVCVYV